jgi:SOS-response transcriptional repressor LexA
MWNVAAICKNKMHQGAKMQYSLTPKQARLLTFIRDYMVTSDGVAPSYEEMLVGTGNKSKANIHRLLAGLAERGHIAQMKNRVRSIVLLGDQE